jgi:cobalt/nickel transport system ATP-binding protein
VALLGLNGSGKTTLLRSVVGLLPHDGTIQVNGTEVTPRSLGTVREQVGFLFNVPEDQLLFPSVLDDVAFGMRRRGLDKSEADDQARDVLGQLGVADLAGRLVYDLSHGQKLRVALAGVLAVRPAVLLLDEPTAGLDPPGRRQLVALLRRQGAAILVATHDLPFAEQLCDRYVVLERGRITYSGAEVDPVRRMWDGAS